MGLFTAPGDRQQVVVGSLDPWLGQGSVQRSPLFLQELACTGEDPTDMIWITSSRIACQAQLDLWGYNLEKLVKRLLFLLRDIR